MIRLILAVLAVCFAPMTGFWWNALLFFGTYAVATELLVTDWDNLRRTLKVARQR